jgi:thiol:disulfide interchange protein DsbA
MLLKKTIAALAFSAVAMMGADFKEGVNYKTLETTLDTGKNSVIKVFSFTCPFCYKYDKAVTEKVIKSIPGVNFEVWHLKTKGKYGQQGSNLMAVARARDLSSAKGVFDKGGYLKKMKFAYYKAYHNKKMRWDSGEDSFYKEGFKILKTDKTAFNKELSSIKVQNLLKRWDASYSVAKVQGIPGFVVNGKYLLMTQKIKSRQYMIDLVKHLMKK